MWSRRHYVHRPKRTYVLSGEGVHFPFLYGGNWASLPYYFCRQITVNSAIFDDLFTKYTLTAVDIWGKIKVYIYSVLQTQYAELLEPQGFSRKTH